MQQDEKDDLSVKADLKTYLSTDPFGFDLSGRPVADRPGSVTWNQPNNPYRLAAQAEQHKGVCLMCGNLAVAFADEASAREYAITGTCQVCQDRIFADPDDEDDDYVDPAEAEDPYESDPAEPPEWSTRQYPDYDEPPF
jgi:hypothetical protein